MGRCSRAWVAIMLMAFLSACARPIYPGAGSDAATDGARFDLEDASAFDARDSANDDGQVASGLVQIAVESYTTTSFGFVEVPGATLSFRPRSADESWLVLFSGRLTPSATAVSSAEVDYLINGEERGLGSTEHNTQAETAPMLGGPWQHFAFISNTTERQQIVVRLRDLAGAGATLSDLRVVAFPLPSGADPHYVSYDELEEITTETLEDAHVFTFNPAAAGEYMLLGLVNANEGTATNAIVNWTAPNGTPWLSANLQVARGVWQSCFAVQHVDLSAGDARVALQARVGTAGTARLRYARFLALRLDAFANVEVVRDTPQRTTTTANPQTLVSLTTAALPQSRYRVYMISHTGGFTVTGSQGYRSFRYLVANEPARGHDHRMHSGYQTSYGAFGVDRGSAPLTLESTFAVAHSTPDAEVFVRDAAIYVLTLP